MACEQQEQQLNAENLTEMQKAVSRDTDMAKRNDAIYKEQYSCSVFSAYVGSSKSVATRRSSIITIIYQNYIEVGILPAFFIS